MKHKCPGILGVLALIVSSLMSSVALAYAIDGGWCSEDNTRRLYISGTEIQLSSGRTITGQYTRHGASCRGPDGDPEAVQEIRMVQQSEEHMQLFSSTVGCCRELAPMPGYQLRIAHD